MDLSGVPGLVVYGEHEAGFVKRQAPALAVALRDGEVREISDAGHAANVDNPAAFTAVLREWLAAHAPERVPAQPGAVCWFGSQWVIRRWSPRRHRLVRPAVSVRAPVGRPHSS